MFSIQKIPFGKSRLLRAANRNGITLDILPDYGAALNSFFIPSGDGSTLIDILDGYSHENEPEETGALYKGVFLFPFPNRLRDGVWQNEGIEFHFPINEPNRNNALHGTLFNCSFEIVETTGTAEMAFIHLRYVSDGKNNFYPFQYQIDIEYILTDTDGLCIRTQVSNLGQKTLPFGLGWHPYFKTGKPVDDWIIQLPGVQALEVDDRMIPTGNLFPYRHFDLPQAFGTTTLDTGFQLNETERFVVQVMIPEQKLKFSVWQWAGQEGYRYVQIYSPPHRNSLAIEPMSCAANALQTGSSGIIFLEAGSSQTFEWGIHFR